MENEIKKPPCFLTRLEVWRFKWNHRYSIPSKHHVNMVSLKGCSAASFSEYIRWGHSLSNKAITAAVTNPACTEALQILTQCKSSLFTNEHISLLRERFGAEWLLDKAYTLPNKETRLLIADRRSELIRQNLSLLCFGTEEEAMLLNLHDTTLTSAYLSAKKYLKIANCPLLLSYSEHEVYEAYFKNCLHFDEICSEVISNRETGIFALMCRYDQLTTAMQKLLIDSGNLEKIKIYSNWRHFDHSLLDYLAQNSSDEVFEFCILNQILGSRSSETVYQRLFERKNKNLLKTYVALSPLLSTAWEIKLLASDDKELALEYANRHKLSSVAVAYILSHGLNERFHVSVADIILPDWETESILFKHGSNNLVKRCLFAGDNLPKLSEFGEGMLFKYGATSILAQYLTQKPERLGVSAQRALLLRSDDKLISLFLKQDDFDAQLAPLFIKTATVQTIIDNLMKHLFTAEKGKYQSSAVACALCERGNNILVNYALRHCTFNEDADVALVQHAPEKYILRRFEKCRLAQKAEVELLRKGSKNLIIRYFAQYSLFPQNELLLLNCCNEELLGCYLKHHSFKNANAKQQLGL